MSTNIWKFFLVVKIGWVFCFSSVNWENAAAVKVATSWPSPLALNKFATTKLASKSNAHKYPELRVTQRKIHPWMKTWKDERNNFQKLQNVAEYNNFYRSLASTSCKVRMFCQRIDSWLKVVTFICVPSLVLLHMLAVCTASFNSTLKIYFHLHFFLLVLYITLVNTIPIFLFTF